MPVDGLGQGAKLARGRGGDDEFADARHTFVLTLPFFGSRSARNPVRVLCLGAHCDDIDLGCGGTLLALLEEVPAAEVTWVTFSGTADRHAELRRSAKQFLRRARASRVIAHSFRDGFLPAHFAAVKSEFEALKALPRPHLIFTHHRDDLHQDHRLVAELTWNTFRSELILEYEIPKYDGGLTTPSVYVGLERRIVEQKIRILLRCYQSQLRKAWFTADTVRGLMRLRGIESGSNSGWAEGYHGRKILAGFSGAVATPRSSRKRRTDAIR